MVRHAELSSRNTRLDNIIKVVRGQVTFSLVPLVVGNIPTVTMKSCNPQLE